MIDLTLKRGLREGQCEKKSGRTNGKLYIDKSKLQRHDQTHHKERIYKPVLTFSSFVTLTVAIVGMTTEK